MRVAVAIVLAVGVFVFMFRLGNKVACFFTFWRPLLHCRSTPLLTCVVIWSIYTKFVQFTREGVSFGFKSLIFRPDSIS